MKRVVIPILFILFAAEMSAVNSRDSVSTDSLPPLRKIVELGIDEKIIYVNELGLPPNTMVYDALTMFPELLGRDIESILNKYDVQLDDVSVGASKYSVLQHTMISEVKHIEITTDPSVSQSSNGVGGVIDIITLDVDTGFSGQVSLDVLTDFEVLPSVTLAYKKDKLTIYGSALMDYYNYKTEKNEFINDPVGDTWKKRDKFYEGLSEAVKFGLAYRFNKRDKLTFWIMQNLDKPSDSTSQRILSTFEYDGGGTYKDGTSSISSPALHSQIDAILKFERLYDRPSQKLYASLSYSNNYATDENYQYTTGSYFGYDTLKRTASSYTSRPHSVSTSLYYRFHLLPADIEHILKLKAGLNTNMSFARGTDEAYAKELSTFDDYTQNFMVMPYLTFNYQWTVLQMELSVKYRFKAARGRGEDAGWQNNYFNNILGNFNITYTPKKGHQLRASTARTMTTPSNLQLYGKIYYKQLENKYYQGNPDLKESTLNNVDLQYFYQYRSRRHEVQLNVALEYVNARDLVIKVDDYSEKYACNYVTWRNSEKANHIFDGRISVFWQTGIFSITLSGNFYDQIDKIEDSNKYSHYYYYNLLLQPVLHFERGWIVSGKCIYNSKISDGNTTIGDAIFMDLNVSKAWGPWSARLKFENTYNYLSSDVIKSGDKTTTTYYNLYQCQVLVGFTYQFFVPNKEKKIDKNMAL